MNLVVQLLEDIANLLRSQKLAQDRMNGNQVSSLNASFDLELITDSSKVSMNGATQIQFENIGSSDAILDNAMPIKVNDMPRTLGGSIAAISNQRFNLKFENESADKKILVTRTFYKVIR